MSTLKNVGRIGCVVAAILLAHGEPSSARQRPRVGPLVGTMREGVACGGEFRRSPKAEGYVFLEDLDGIPRMMLDGRVVQLTLASTNEPARRLKIGERFESVYEAPGVRVELSQRVTFACPAADPSESCEATRTQATFIVTSGGRVERVAAYGRWGC